MSYQPRNNGRALYYPQTQASYGQQPNYFHQPFPAPQKPKKKEQKPLFAMFFAFLAVICIGVTFALPWWGTTTASQGQTANMNLKLTGYDISSSGTTVSGSYTDPVLGGSSFRDTLPNTVGVFDSTISFIAVSLLFAILVLILTFLCMFSKINTKIVALFLLISFIAVLATAGSFAVQLPQAINTDSKGSSIITGFSGSETTSSGTTSWGPQSGWGLMLIAGIIQLFGFILMLLTKTESISKKQVSQPSMGQKFVYVQNPTSYNVPQQQFVPTPPPRSQYHPVIQPSPTLIAHPRPAQSQQIPETNIVFKCPKCGGVYVEGGKCPFCG